MTEMTEMTASQLVKLELHPMCEQFNCLEGQEMIDLCESIMNTGLQQPIVIQNEKVIDGQNRVQAIKNLLADGRIEEEQTYPIKTLNLKDNDLIGYVIGANITRRHLTPKERVELVKTLLESQGITLRPRGVTDKSASAINTVTVGEVAEMAGTSEGSVRNVYSNRQRPAAAIVNPKPNATQEITEPNNEEHEEYDDQQHDQLSIDDDSDSIERQARRLYDDYFERFASIDNGFFQLCIDYTRLLNSKNK
jgi:hypothetical protein